MAEFRLAPQARKDLKALSSFDSEVVIEAIVAFAQTGIGDVRKLQAVKPSTWRLRVGRYRILYRREGPVLVVLRVSDRRDAYR